MSDDRRIVPSIKQVIAILLGAVVVLFAAINVEPATVRLFFWETQVSTALLLLVPLLVGFLLGWMYARRRDRRKRRREREPAPGDAGEPEGEGPSPGPDQLEGSPSGGGPSPSGDRRQRRPRDPEDDARR